MRVIKDDQGHFVYGWRLGRALCTGGTEWELTCDQASLIFCRGGKVRLIFVCRPLIKISVSANVGDAISGKSSRITGSLACYRQIGSKSTTFSASC